MADHLMMVLSNARPELENEFNDWYSKVHIVDIVDQLDGFIAAQRFVLSGEHADSAATFKYLALYWIQEDKLAEAQAAIAWQRAERGAAEAAGRQPVIPKLDVFAGETQAWFFSKISDKYAADDSDVTAD